MSGVAIIGLCVMLVGAIGFGAKLLVEAEVLDVLALVSICVALGYLWGRQ